MIGGALTSLILSSLLLIYTRKLISQPVYRRYIFLRKFFLFYVRVYDAEIQKAGWLGEGAQSCQYIQIPFIFRPVLTLKDSLLNSLDQ